MEIAHYFIILHTATLHVPDEFNIFIRNVVNNRRRFVFVIFIWLGINSIIHIMEKMVCPQFEVKKN